MNDDYDPENEIDPAKIQKEQLEISKKFMAKFEKAEAEEAARKAEYAAHGPVRVYTPPSFEAVSAVVKKAWDEVEKIMPTAQDRVKAAAFQTLLQAALRLRSVVSPNLL